MSVKLLTEQHLEFLSLKGDWTGSSESTLFKIPHCWIPHRYSFVMNSRKRVSSVLFQTTDHYHLILSCSSDHKGLGSQRGEIGPAIEMHTDLKYVYMVYFIEKNRNFICLVLKL